MLLWFGFSVYDVFRYMIACHVKHPGVYLSEQTNLRL